MSNRPVVLPPSPIARVLSGRYVLLVSEYGWWIKQATTADNLEITRTEAIEIIAYSCVHRLDNWRGFVVYGTRKGQLAMLASIGRKRKQRQPQ